ncbi:MAG: polysaccharide deacetylase family protein [Paracoccaceae bacterium]|nr:polysaccharide deacetylase family protein [Paracoccaceae bacterium]MDG1737942.1 polysaccharide deacetylase family protein [Paracoccaceae bacterium]MDG2258818.1 polysaccharide deacetylase family protein [Paracoccaceae bacterium]
MIRLSKIVAAIAGLLSLTACEHEDEHPTVVPPVEIAKTVAPYAVNRTKLPGQIIHIAFDGSSSLPVWQDTLDFALEQDVKFTFFIVGTHLLNDDLATLYDPPRRKPGRSDVGFGGTKEEVEQRLNMLRRAYREGHEIAGHANGHWDGTNFSYAEWTDELAQFHTFLTQAYTLNEIDNPNSAEWRRLVDSIIGFRAPLLAHNPAMYQALADAGYKYDTSQVLKLTTTPDYQESGVVIYPLHSLSTARGRTITMDYNFYVLDDGRVEGSGANMLNAYQNHLRIAQDLGQAPIQIGHHFSRWNRGNYWWAVKEFIKTNCGNDNIRCMTFSERYKLETR